MGREGGPSPKDMGIEVPIGSPESDMEYVLGPDGKPTDVIKPKPGREIPKPPEGLPPV